MSLGDISRNNGINSFKNLLHKRMKTLARINKIKFFKTWKLTKAVNTGDIYSRKTAEPQ